MGGRGSFVNTSAGDFRFVDNGQQYICRGMVGDAKIIKKIRGNIKSASSPLLSHTANRIYSTIKNGEFKYLSFYDENHNQIKTINFDHTHNGVQPHVHYNMEHNKSLPGVSPSSSDMELIKKIMEVIKKK